MIGAGTSKSPGTTRLVYPGGRSEEKAMSRHQKQSERRHVIPIWTYSQAHRATPYIVSIMQSLRDARLEAQRWNVRASRLAAKPGRPNRSSIIAHEEALREARRAEDRFEEA